MHPSNNSDHFLARALRQDFCPVTLGHAPIDEDLDGRQQHHEHQRNEKRRGDHDDEADRLVIDWLVNLITLDMISGMGSVQYRNTYDQSFKRIGRTGID
ncbi:MAG TPA: hypothetical protein VF443_09670 [Nitrospira sp.]